MSLKPCEYGKPKHRSNLAQKLVRMMDIINMVFAGFAPGLHPFDGIIGILGTAVIRLVTYVKAKNAAMRFPDRRTFLIIFKTNSSGS